MTIKSKILIVDDTVDTVELLKKRFRADGYDTMEAFDGQEGLDKVREFGPDLIILDVMMPKVDGFQVCERLKKDASTRHIPILMLTAKSEINDKVKGFDYGADGYITKPFNYKEIAARIRSLLAQKTASMELAAKERREALDHVVNEVSHEVRNPLVAIGGFARRIRKNLHEGDPNQKYLDIIVKNVEVLEAMVSQLMALKSATLAYAEFADVNILTSEALDKYKLEIEKKQIKVKTDFMETPPALAADHENLSAAIAHIVKNAIEAMAESARRELTITTAVHEGHFEILIADTGKGIPRNKIKNIFDPFFSSKIYGPGLGLTFALKTIQSHKGMITVESEKNEGTSFTIRLPVHTGSM
ncbi:MAG: response regulator [Desulfobulbaceae bacterium]|nr:response regulator [Desulfobulbaceae bacterium]